MFKIVSTTTGKEVGKAENVLYIKKKGAVNVETTRAEAQGVAYKSEPYNLAGTEGVGAEETVVVVECDGGVETSETQAAVAANSAAIDDIIISMLEG